MGRIVVGVDGSNRSKDALRWAAREAEALKSELDVVMTWAPLNPDAWVPHDTKAPDRLAPTRRAIERIVRSVLGEHPGVQVRARAVEGPAAKTLLREAEDADLLVVGNRGHGGFAGLLLGSVSMQCVTHARCPVVVVRGPSKTRS
jgi:nucleotide-binding universal stress UspA family protein